MFSLLQALFCPTKDEMPSNRLPGWNWFGFLLIHDNRSTKKNQSRVIGYNMIKGINLYDESYHYCHLTE